MKYNNTGNESLKIGYGWWERSVYPYGPDNFLNVNSSGRPSDYYIATYSLCICPAWCF